MSLPRQAYQHTRILTVAVPLVDGTEVKLAGIKPDEAASFISSANDAFREHIARQFDAIEEELKALSDVAQTAKNGRLYFACEHRHLCGRILNPCNVCNSDLPVPGIFIEQRFWLRGWAFPLSESARSSGWGQR